MSVITKTFMENVKYGYNFLKKKEDDDAVFIRYRNGSERYIDFIMQKYSYYYGKYACFDGSAYVCNFSEDFLESLLQASNSK